MKKSSNRSTFSITELTHYVDSLFKQDLFLQSIWVKGEISGFTIYQKSGHCYFSLKDENAILSSVMFKFKASKLNFRPVDGMEVFARGSISVFAKQGKYQLMVEEMELCGQGDLFIYLERLKRELAEAGYFDPAAKQALPAYIRCVGIVSSLQAAALQDIIHVLQTHEPSLSVVIADTLVQGADAPVSIAAAIERMNRYQKPDVLIVARGGGSIEDLMAFNSVEVVKALYASRIPIISGVGHEVDFSLCDLAADVRASTPTRAAQMVVAVNQQARQKLLDQTQRLKLVMLQRLGVERRNLEHIIIRPIWQSAAEVISPYAECCEDWKKRMCHAADNNLREIRYRFMLMSSRLDGLSPLKILARGYSVLSHEGRLVKSVTEVVEGDKMEAQLSDGVLSVEVVKQVQRV